jgi:phosphoacetylglucosamine mutase
VKIRNARITATLILHYLVRAINTKGTKDEYGPDFEEGYVAKLTAVFKKLIVGPHQEKPSPQSKDI